MDVDVKTDVSDDSDFDELDEPDTPGDYLDCTDGDLSSLVEHSSIRHTITSGISVDAGKPDHQDSKIIPFSSIHKPPKGLTHIRPDCWMKDVPINVSITDVQREHHPHMTRKAFNPNLYTIEITHGEYKWMVRRRFKHFDSLHKALRLFRARYTLPMPTKQHRERRQSIREERKERKIKKKQRKSISRFPNKPEIMVREEGLEKRRQHLELYLQSILESKWYRNHTEVLKFLDVSELSFVNRLGQKWKEGDVNKCSGGRRISIGCCGCLKKYHVAGRWSKRWLVVKDTFIAYIRPSDGVLCDVMLMDSEFRVESGMSATGAPHGLLVMNQS
ncbi:phospholipase D1-like, partial [Ruditapes philippinarum]|uniref:phospholipase D1-like n=1 Tax=Ruditapes philippinarum TaxID=129788 RepID=UPI00295ADC19